MTPFPLEKRDTHPLSFEPGEIILFSCVRNESTRLPYFFQYYRALGVDRFVFVDNASHDGTLEILLAQPLTHVFFTADSYAQTRCGMDWLNQLLHRYGVGRWVVVVDADELLVYPHSEQIGVHALTRYLDRRKEQAMMTFLLDMYGSGPIRSIAYQPGQPFLDCCPYFDGDTYQFPATGPFENVPIRGGARKRLFFQREGLRGKPPVLRKIPLVRWREEFRFEASTHRLQSVRMADVSGALLHFKLFSDLSTQVQQEIRRQEHWDDAAQYEAYGLTLEADPQLNPMYEGTMRYRNSLHLVELGFLNRPADYPGAD